jgi:hypothetical protein
MDFMDINQLIASRVLTLRNARGYSLAAWPNVAASAVPIFP